ncbi:MAG: serine hydrolase domain-containing protein [Chitinophagaceae bacterium]
MSYNLKSNCLKFSSLLAFLLLLQPVWGQYNFSGLDDLVAKNEKVVGKDVIVMIYKDGKLVYTKQTNKEFTPKTQAPIADASKWLTAALAMMFVEEGKISLDDPVTKYIPIFGSYSKKYITIRNCLAQTTGIHAEEPGLKAAIQNRKYETLEDEVNAFAKREIERNPNEMFFYSNIGVNIVGRVLEIVSKKGFDRLIADKLLRPLKMRQTSFSGDFDKAQNPSGGAVSNANDYMNFLSMILNKGMFEGKRLISEQSIAEMQKVQTGSAAIKYQPAITLGYGYGLGVWIRDKDATGAGTVITSPGIYGTYPIIDNCRGYAALVFVSKLMDDQKKVFYDDMKEIIDQQISSSNCK